MCSDGFPISAALNIQLLRVLAKGTEIICERTRLAQVDKAADLRTLRAFLSAGLAIELEKKICLNFLYVCLEQRTVAEIRSGFFN